MRAVIEMDGGLVRNVLCDEPLEVLVIDRDTEGMESEEGITLPNGERVFVQTMDAEEDELTVEGIFNRAMDGGDGFEIIEPRNNA